MVTKLRKLIHNVAFEYAIVFILKENESDHAKGGFIPQPYKTPL